MVQYLFPCIFIGLLFLQNLQTMQKSLSSYFLQPSLKSVHRKGKEYFPFYSLRGLYVHTLRVTTGKIASIENVIDARKLSRNCNLSVTPFSVHHYLSLACIKVSHKPLPFSMIWSLFRKKINRQLLSNWCSVDHLFVIGFFSMGSSVLQAWGHTVH